MSSSSSSPRPNLDFYRKQAKQLVRDVRAGEGRALERIRPQLRHIVSLADAQLVVAREQGFQSWASFQEDAARSAEAPAEVASRALAPTPTLEQLAELLAGEAFVWPRQVCERLRAALHRGDSVDAAGAVCAMEWALGEIAAGLTIEADYRSSRRTGVERSVADRAMRALELLSRVTREEALDLSVIRCSFCLKDNHQVAKLLRGSKGYICDVCTAAAAEILQKHAS
jgi:hypothetical protein